MSLRDALLAAASGRGEHSEVRETLITAAQRYAAGPYRRRVAQLLQEGVAMRLGTTIAVLCGLLFGSLC